VSDPTRSVLRAFIVPALLTGGFCSVFAVTVDMIMDLVSAWHVAVLGGVSGFLGSIFARTVLRGRK